MIPCPTTPDKPPSLPRLIRNRLGKVKDKLVSLWETEYIPVEKLLLGGEQGVRPAKYAELSGDFFRPSTPFAKGFYCRFLDEYKSLGNDLLNDGVFQKTDFYRNAIKCIELYGVFERYRESELRENAQKFIEFYEQLRQSVCPGEKRPGIEPIIVRPVKYSSYYSVIDGSKRAAAAIVAGATHVPALVPDTDPILTPLQQLLLDVQWTLSKKELYQPVDSPEIREQWTLIRKSTDRMTFMSEYLRQKGLLPQAAGAKTYCDLGSSYGWFVQQFRQLGFEAFGVERDPVAVEVGQKVYGISAGQITRSDIVECLQNGSRAYDVVSLLSVMHHFVRGKNTSSAVRLIQLVDQITQQVLFLDMGQEHEPAFKGTLKGWSPEFIRQWILDHTNFREVVPLGVDDDAATSDHLYYGRTLFACAKNSS